MPSRSRLLFTFALTCITPLLILSVFNYLYVQRNTETLLAQDLDDELHDTVTQFDTAIHDRERELQLLAAGPLKEYLRSTPAQREASSPNLITSLPTTFAAVGLFGSDRKPIFFAETNAGSWTSRSKDFIPDAISPDERVWNGHINEVYESLMHVARFGDVWRCTLPVVVEGANSSQPTRGALVADIHIDTVLATLDHSDNTREMIVLDEQQKLVYDRNAALRNQPLITALPARAPFGQMMVSKAPGRERYLLSDGHLWLTVHQPLKENLWLAISGDLTLVGRGGRRAGLIGIVLSLLLGLTAAAIITALYLRNTKSLDRVTASVAAIAEGNLDEEVLLRSSDDMRGLADNVNRMTERMREQLAKEAETRQFDSFARLSAMLAHDLKNAIEGLSLMVGNMEKHFDNPTFRADAIEALTLSTEKLRQLVTRLSNPVHTLSGEFKMPKPTDLVPLLQRVVREIAEPVRERHKIVVDLPRSLFAMVDSERMEKVMENLVLNAIEAMNATTGTLTITAGPTDDGKVFFSVSDTGPGISADFIQHKLFHAFATTKPRGVGLGLYTCREVVRANNGSIEVKSELGSGTTFRVVLASAPSPVRTTFT